MEPLICKCCGGKIDPVTMKCIYCDTAYVDDYEQIRRIKQENNSIKTQIDKEELYNAALNAMKDYNSTIMTPNEVREKIGLNPVVDFGVTVEEATDRLLALGRCGSYLKNAYDTDGRKICSFTITCHHN